MYPCPAFVTNLPAPTSYIPTNPICPPYVDHLPFSYGSNVHLPPTSITSVHPYFNQTSRFPPLPLRLLIIKKIHFTWLLWCHPTNHQGAAKRCCSTSAPAVRSACRTTERMPSQPRTRSAWRPDASVDMYLFTWFCWGRLGGLGGKLGK